MKDQHDAPMALHNAHRELHKWLNEEQTKPIDRVALATVLLAVAKQIDARIAAAELAMAAPEREPFGWSSDASSYILRGEHAEMTAKAQAKAAGGSCVAYPVYRTALQSHPVAGHGSV